MLFPEGCTYRRVALATLRSHGLPFHVSFVSPSFDCLRSALVEGLGLSVLARVLVAPPVRVARRVSDRRRPAVSREGRVGYFCSRLRVKRKCVMSAGKNIPHVHSTKMRSLRPSVGMRER